MNFFLGNPQRGLFFLGGGLGPYLMAVLQELLQLQVVLQALHPLLRQLGVAVAPGGGQGVGRARINPPTPPLNLQPPPQPQQPPSQCPSFPQNTAVTRRETEARGGGGPPGCTRQLGGGTLSPRGVGGRLLGAEGVHGLRHAGAVEVALALEALASLQGQLDLVEAELHGGAEVPVLLDGVGHGLHRVRQLGVGQRGLLGWGGGGG